MCTKEEVREVIKETVTPIWVRYLIGLVVAIALSLQSWSLITVHEQEAKSITHEKHIAAVLSEMSEKISSVAIRLELLKEATERGTSDRYFGKDAEAREKLVDEQFKNTHFRHDMSQERQDRASLRQDKTDNRLDRIEEIIKEYHNE